MEATDAMETVDKSAETAGTAKRKRGRPGVTYDRVAQACLTVRAAGQHVTALRVLNVLGTGSTGTLHPMVKRWNEENPLTNAVVAPTLSDGLLRDIGRELGRIATEAKAGAQEELLEATEAANKFASEIQDLESEQDALNDLVESLTLERDQAVALATERQQKIEQLAGSLAREQSAAESARIELAKEQLRTEASVVKVQAQADTLREKDLEIARLRGELDSERKTREKSDLESAKLTAQFEAEKVAKTEAVKREADALVRERDALVERDSVKSAAEQRVLDILGKVAELEKALITASSKAASEEAKCGMLIEQVQDLKPRLDRAEASLEKMREAQQAMALAAKAPPPKPSPAVAEDEELLKPPSPPPSRKRSGAQLQDRQAQG